MPERSLSPQVRVTAYRRRYRTRRLLAALVVAIIAVIAGSVAAQFASTFVASGEFSPALWGAFGAAVAAFTAAAFMPAIRRISGRSSEARLMMAASPTHPLLHELMVYAPGTYAHSVAVANIAEAAADEIGANGLLVRVGSYYHDVGKLTAPCYYFENLEEGENPHDAFDPAQSVAVITSHVREGERLAREHHLPGEVEAIIREHHGTSLVRYFFHKAGGADSGAFEAEFRYQGDLPSSREAALVMLCDASEASVRAIKSREAGAVEAAIREVVDERLSDGQLAQSGMTDEDIETTVGVLTGMLMSMYHARCEYPKVGAGKPKDAQAC